MATEKKQKALSDWAPEGGAVLPLAVPLNMAGERTGAPVALTPPPSKPVVPALIGVVLGAVLTAVTLSLVSPTVVPEPIVIVSASGAVAPAAPAPAPAPAAVPAPPKPAAVAAAAAPAPAEKPATAKAVEKPAEKPAEPNTSVKDMFAKVAVDPSAPIELTQDEINEVIGAHRAATGACAEKQRTVAPDTTGTLTVKWNVENEGKVNNVTPLGDLAETEFATCLVKEISGWTFPKHDVPHPPVQSTFKF